jgi:Arc/MetJ-type ribon-helix-helix transcriptional regulator
VLKLYGSEESVPVEREKVEVEVDKELLAWLDECISKGTFANRSRAIELSLVLSRDTAIGEGVSQESNPSIKASIPLDWEKIKSTYQLPEFGAERKRREEMGK